MTTPKARQNKSAQTERRIRAKRSEKDLYTTGVDAFIQKERRKDELQRLNEVRQQKVTWRATVLLCFLFNLALVMLALYGGMIQ